MKKLFALALALASVSAMAMSYQDKPLTPAQAKASELRLTKRNNEVQSIAAQADIVKARAELAAVSGDAASSEARLTASNKLVEALAKDPNQPKFVLDKKYPQKDDDGNWMPGARR